MEAFYGFLIFLAMIAAYILPWIVAKARQHNNSLMIFWLSVLLGWTGIGWLVALIIACSENTRNNQKMFVYRYK